MEVPEDAKDFALHHLGDIQKLVFTSAIQDPLGCGGDMTILPPGTWEIVCTSKEATEEQAAQIVERDGNGYKDYAAGPPENDYGDFVLASNSLNSLLTSKGCDLKNNYLILKKTA
jgi:hypothetical protein